jgi:MFS family permease
MPDVSAAPRVGWGFVARYTLAYLSTCLLFIAPLLVTLALKVNALVGIERAPGSLALVAGTGALVSMVGNPLFGALSDRTTARLGMRRPWMVIGLVGGSAGILVVAVAPTVAVVLVGWCIAQLMFNALLAALVAVLPDQVPAGRRGLVAGVLGICVSPRRSPDFAWAFASRFLFVLAYAFLTTFQAYYLLSRLGSAEADVPRQIFLGTLVQSVAVVTASLAGGRLSDRTGRRKIFVAAAAVVYGIAMFAVAVASDFDGFLVGMAIGGIGFGMYMAVDLALVVDVLPDRGSAAKDLGVFNIAGALPFSIAPAIAPAVLAIGSYGTLYAAAGVCALLAAVAIVPVRRVR